MHVEIQERVALAPHTTLHVGGEARFFARPVSEPQLEAALTWARERHLPVVAMGGGSNLLVQDEGFPGLILHMELAPRIDVEPAGPAVEYTATAGVSWEDLVDRVCADGLTGLECLAGIPGLTGACPVQNIGAYGQEVAQTIRRVRTWDRQLGHFVQLAAGDCGFGYRRSRFQAPGGGAAGRFLITAVTFGLAQDARPQLSYAELRQALPDSSAATPREIAATVRVIRRRKGMLVTPGDPDSRSAGSFFKNPIVPAERLAAIAASASVEAGDVPSWPVPPGAGPALPPSAARIKLSAAWLVERAGFPKGFRLGPAAVSSRHALALTNRTGDATFADIAQLRDTIRAGVQDRFGLTLEQEPIELGPATHDPWSSL